MAEIPGIECRRWIHERHHRPFPKRGRIAGLVDKISADVGCLSSKARLEKHSPPRKSQKTRIFFGFSKRQRLEGRGLFLGRWAVGTKARSQKTFPLTRWAMINCFSGEGRDGLHSHSIQPPRIRHPAYEAARTLGLPIPASSNNGPTLIIVGSTDDLCPENCGLSISLFGQAWIPACLSLAISLDAGESREKSCLVFQGRESRPATSSTMVTA